MKINCVSIPEGANCYTVLTDKAAIVIDPYSPQKAVCDFLKSNAELNRYILLTHCHFDHILGALELRNMFGVPVAIGEKDAVGLYNTAISLSEAVGLRQEPFYADILFGDGDVLELGEEALSVIHTPGHTAGSVCYRIGDVIFSGDLLFKNSIGRTDFPTGGYGALIKSVKRLADFNRNFTVYPGHGEKTDLFGEIKNNPYLKELR